MEPVTLTDQRLVLRPYQPADIPAVYAACQDPEIQRWTSVPSPYTELDAQRYVLELSPLGWAGGTETNFGVFTTAGELAGSLSLMNISAADSRDGRIAEIGFWAAPQLRGRGYLTDASRLVCTWGFQHLGLARIEWYAAVGNVASRRVAEKVSFRYEGTLRSRLGHRGDRQDAWLAGLLPGDLIKGA